VIICGHSKNHTHRRVEINEILNKLSHRNTEEEVKLGAGVVDRESTFKRKKKTIKKVS
jgi:hypothetical protein